MKYFIAFCLLMFVQILGIIFYDFYPNQRIITEKTFCTWSGMVFMWFIYNWRKK